MCSLMESTDEAHIGVALDVFVWLLGANNICTKLLLLTRYMYTYVMDVLHADRE